MSGLLIQLYVCILILCIHVHLFIVPGKIAKIVDNVGSTSARSLSEETNSAGSCFPLSFPVTGLSILPGGLPLDVSPNQSQITSGGLSLTQPQPASSGPPSGVDTSSQLRGGGLPLVSSTLTQVQPASRGLPSGVVDTSQPLTMGRGLPSLTQLQPASRGPPSGVDNSSQPLTTGRGLPSLTQLQPANSGLPSIISDSNLHQVMPSSSSVPLPSTNTGPVQNFLRVHSVATPLGSPLKQIDPSGKLVVVW